MVRSLAVLAVVAVVLVASCAAWATSWPPGSPGWLKMASASDVSDSPSGTDWPCSGGRTPKPELARPRHAALVVGAPDGAVARIQAEVCGATSLASVQSSHGSCWGRPSSPTTQLVLRVDGVLRGW